VVVPVFEDPEEQQLSPYRDEDWYADRMSWNWMNTIMRVNSLVQKVCLSG
jgi:tRNA-splicing endonuclease subunit Sen2